jgi:AraC family transcriptional regulator
LPLAIVPLSIERRAERRHVERADPIQTHLPHRVAANMVHPIVEISPPDSMEHRTASWPGMAAEIVQATRSDRIESCFCAPVHLLAVYEHGMRREGETFVERLPSSTLRDFRRKLVFVPAGHKYRDWQEPRIRTRVAYFVALKLTTLIEGAGKVHRLYAEALGVLMAHELIRLQTAVRAAFAASVLD